MKLTESEIDKKIEAIISLQGDWRWKEFTEAILFYQGTVTQELFSKRFMKLTAQEKDKEHNAIVRVLNALNFVLDVPDWLSRRSYRRWEQVENNIRKETENARRK